MILQLFKKKKQFALERTYHAPIATVWDAWTKAEMLQQWWGPKNTFVPECRIDARVGGEVHVVMEAGEGMGKYAGTRWPMAGIFTRVDPVTRMTYDARSWTDGQQATSTIEHTNDITLREQDGKDADLHECDSFRRGKYVVVVCIIPLIPCQVPYGRNGPGRLVHLIDASNR